MKKKIIIIFIFLIVLCILFVPAILKMSSSLKIKNKAVGLVDKKVSIVDELKNIGKFATGKKKDSNNKQDVVEDIEIKESISTEKLGDEKVEVETIDVKENGEDEESEEITVFSMSPLEEIDWLLQNIYLDDEKDSHNLGKLKNYSHIQWENIKTEKSMSYLRSVSNSVDKLLEEVPKSEVLSLKEATKLRTLMISYEGAIDYLLKQKEGKVSAKEALYVVIKSYDQLMDYYSNLKSTLKVKGKEFELNFDDIKLDGYFEIPSIKSAFEKNGTLLGGDIAVHLKRVSVRDVEGKPILSFDIEIEGRDVSRVELYSQYGLYESVGVHISGAKVQKRRITFSKSYPAEGIYVIKVISSDGNYGYKRYSFYPRITLFPLEYGEYKLPFMDDDYQKLDDFFEIRVLRTRISKSVFDKELVTDF